MSKSFRVFLLVAGLAFVAVGTALAHEHREVGEYSIVFGWRVEPAVAGGMNGPEITVTRATAEGEAEGEGHEEGDEHEEGAGGHDEAEAVPVEGLEETLTLEVSFGGVSRIVPLRGAWMEPGHYIADLIPTRPGDYTFVLTGTIEGVEVNETFNSATDNFSTVDPIEDIQFPDAYPNLFDLLARIEALEAEVAELSGG